MKTSDIETFFSLLRTGLWSDIELKDVRYNRYAEPEGWNNVYQLAEEQSVIGVVLEGVEHSFIKPSQDLLLQWIGEVQIVEQQNKAMNQFIEKLINKMRDAGVYTLLLKGQGVAQCYEKPLWRCSGDVDLFLSEKNYQKAKDLLIPLASSVNPESAYNKHLGMTIDSWTVELHGRLRCGLSTRIDRVLDEIKNDTFYGGNVRSWMNGNTQVFLLGLNGDIVYVFTHFLNHFYKEGLGVRQICDWCRLLWRYRSEVDSQLLETRIRRMGLMSEWKAFGAFAVEYLGMPKEAMPLYSADARWKKKASLICDFILEVGNMGHNRGSWLMEHDSWLSRQYIVRKAFSMFRRIGDLINHARIFPLDSLRFFPRIMFNGLRSAMRGEG